MELVSRSSTSRLTRALAPASVLVLACTPEPPPPAEPHPPPARTAAGDRDVRSLLLDVASARLCDGLTGRLLPLPASTTPSGPAAGAAPAAGRLLVESCTASEREGRLALSLAGRGWTSVDEASAGPLGSRFAVRGLLRFRLEASIAGEVDIGYDRARRVVSLWVSPRAVPSVRIEPAGPVPVEPDGSWSGVVGRVGELLGGSLTARAEPLVAAGASALVASRLRSGLTATLDLCSGQIDGTTDALGPGLTPERPFPEDGAIWLDNQRVAIPPGGLDAAGPFEAARGLRVDLEVERGPGVELRLMCRDRARAVLEAFLARRPAAPATAHAERFVEPGRVATVEVPGAGCPLVVLATPRGELEQAVTLRYRVRAAGAERRPIVDCPDR